MGFIREIVCTDCKEKKSVWEASGDLKSICDECQSKALVIARMTHFHNLKSLTLEERLRKVEEWIYDFRPRYVPPPKY